MANAEQPAAGRAATIVDYLGHENMGFISRLELNPRDRSVGNMTGDHKSRQTGEGIEFSVHRQYVQGDNLRRLDWNVYGRTDRLYVKTYEETTELRGLICLDASGSMSFSGDPDGQRMSKFDFACRLAAAVAYILIRQGDAVSLVVFGSEVHKVLPRSSSPVQISRILETLRGIRCEEPRAGREDPPMSRLLHDVADRFDRKEFLVLISDLMEDPSALSGVLGHFRHDRHEGLLLHTMDPMELDFPFRGWMRFESMEARADRQLLETGGFRKAYLEALGGYLGDIRRTCMLHGFDYITCRTSNHWRKVLFDVLTRRKMTGRR